MNVTADTTAKGPVVPETPGRDWLLLLYFLPARQAHARVQAWRRLQRAGAVSLKNSAYVLPHSGGSREGLEWIKGEVVGSGGQAVVGCATGLAPATPERL